MYDFLYVPMNKSFTANVGFAFVNFDNPENAQRFQKIAPFSNMKNLCPCPEKPLLVIPAAMQVLICGTWKTRGRSCFGALIATGSQTRPLTRPTTIHTARSPEA